MFSYLLFYRTVLVWLGLCQHIAECFLEMFLLLGCIFLWNWYNIRGLLNAWLCIALKLIEYQWFFKLWAAYWSEIDKISETCWILVCILIWSWYATRGLLSAGLYIALKFIEDRRLAFIIYFSEVTLVDSVALLIFSSFRWNIHYTNTNCSVLM